MLYSVIPDENSGKRIQLPGSSGSWRIERRGEGQQRSTTTSGPQFPSTLPGLHHPLNGTTGRYSG
ncbi:hypothetical protein ACYEXS_12695 [Paenibacillus sp. MAH-36]